MYTASSYSMNDRSYFNGTTITCYHEPRRCDGCGAELNEGKCEYCGRIDRW